MVGDGSVFERGSHVSVTHMAFFEPPATSFLSELCGKDRRSAKEWVCVNTAGVWLELGQTVLALARDGRVEDEVDVMSRHLALADKAFEAVREVLRIRATILWDTGSRQRVKSHSSSSRVMTPYILRLIRVCAPPSPNVSRRRQQRCWRKPI
jgi:hypothetical protein